MAVPKRRKTRSKRGMRRSHDAYTNGPTLAEDPVTGEKHQRHCVTATGFYRGKLMVPKLNPAYRDSVSND